MFVTNIGSMEFVVGAIVNEVLEIDVSIDSNGTVDETDAVEGSFRSDDAIGSVDESVAVSENDEEIAVINENIEIEGLVHSNGTVNEARAVEMTKNAIECVDDGVAVRNQTFGNEGLLDRNEVIDEAAAGELSNGAIESVDEQTSQARKLRRIRYR